MLFTTDPPNLEKEQKGKKSILVVKCVANTQEGPFPNGIAKDVVFMELNKPILENLLATCQVSCAASRLTEFDDFSGHE